MLFNQNAGFKKEPDEPCQNITSITISVYADSHLKAPDAQKKGEHAVMCVSVQEKHVLAFAWKSTLLFH